MRTPRTVHEIHDLVLSAERTGDVAAQARRLRRMADRLPTGPGSLRAEMLVAVGELLVLAGDPEGALQTMLDAVADGGAVRLDVRACVAMARAGVGDVEGARAGLADLLRDLPTSLTLHLYVGERCGGHGMSNDALAWLTRGVVLAERRGEYGLEVAMLLAMRCAVREGLGLPADDWDVTAARLIEQMEEWRAEAEEQPSAGDLVAVTSAHGDDVVIDLVRV